MNRESIPAELKRKLLVEAGHRCAIPTCRHPTTEIAHIESYAKVRKHEYNNLIALCPNCHTRFDKGEIDKKSMLAYKSKLIFLSDRYTGYELSVLDHLRTLNKVIIYGQLSIKNLLDEELVINAHTICKYTYNDGSTELQEFIVVLTEKGKQFIQMWIDPNSYDLTYEN